MPKSLIPQYDGVIFTVRWFRDGIPSPVSFGSRVKASLLDSKGRKNGPDLVFDENHPSADWPNGILVCQMTPEDTSAMKPGLFDIEIQVVDQNQNGGFAKTRLIKNGAQVIETVVISYPGTAVAFDVDDVCAATGDVIITGECSDSEQSDTMIGVGGLT